MNVMLQRKEVVCDAPDILPPLAPNALAILRTLATNGFTGTDSYFGGSFADATGQAQKFGSFTCRNTDISSVISITAGANFAGEPFGSQFELQADILKNNEQPMLLIVTNMFSPAVLAAVTEIFKATPPSTNTERQIDGILLKTGTSYDKKVYLSLSTIPGPMERQPFIGVWQELVGGQKAK